VRIREAQVSDAGGIAKVHVDSWRTTYEGIVPGDYLDSLSYEQRTSFWHDRLSDPNSARFAYVAEEDDGDVVGFAVGGPERSGDSVYTGELEAIYRLETHQRRGIGRRLIATVAARLTREGHHSMLVWVLSTNPSRLFYEALGGVEVAEKEIAVGGVNLVEVAYGWRDIHALACTQALTDQG